MSGKSPPLQTRQNEKEHAKMTFKCGFSYSRDLEMRTRSSNGHKQGGPHGSDIHVKLTDLAVSTVKPKCVAISSGTETWGVLLVLFSSSETPHPMVTEGMQ